MVTINNFPNYVLTKRGEVINKVTNKKLSIDYSRNYPAVILYNKSKRKTCFIHRLVAEHFIENVDNKPIVNHKDLNRNNYKLSNLEWCTYSENTLHYWKNKKFKK